jgi:hypothetical protein
VSLGQLVDDVWWLLGEMEKILEDSIRAVDNADLTRPERNELIAKYRRLLGIIRAHKR